MKLNTFFKKPIFIMGAFKALLYSLILLAFFSANLGAQKLLDAQNEENANVDVDVAPTSINEDGGVEMETYLVDDFENSDLWYGSMFIDEGVIRTRKAEGGPAELREANPDGSLYVLGAKINFFKRSFAQAAVTPPQPIRLPGIASKISVWANGKNLNHEVMALVRDMRGRPYAIKMGDLNFSGWKKLSVDVPLFIEQDNPDYATPYRRRGLEFVGLIIKFDPYTALGVMFTYFDNLEIETNMYLEKIDLEQAKLKSSQRNEPLDDW